jgi:hypothetical protein
VIVPDWLIIACVSLAVLYGVARLTILMINLFAPPPPRPFSSEWPVCFTLLATDPTAPDVIRRWADLRVFRGLNRLDDPLIILAQKLADDIEHAQRVFIQSTEKPY